ncbi:tumor necrosis factor ligand superfamily member 6-like isoform X1 [Brachyistius frenatus]|uniref:tumor necrosis factor ligand superfamily member 6-like isoform X1 n=1 Tax=Brachyistius frenatus TaxID=100188 RepID=UPI0037E8B0CE
MAEGGYPSVYMVDCHATQLPLPPLPPLPPRLSQGRRHAGMAQTLLFLLVSLALCGMVIEACFIYRLYQPDSATSGSFSKLTADHAATTPTRRPSYDILPSKPVAHLTDGQDVVHEKHVMAWSMDADPLLYEMTYKDRKLIIQKEGYYFVYSKVFFTDSGTFYHYVQMHTDKYADGNITLLHSRKYSPVSTKMRSSSYIGGVFHLYENDALYVSVSSTSKIQRHKPFDNVFGAYMI